MATIYPTIYATSTTDGSSLTLYDSGATITYTSSASANPGPYVISQPVLGTYNTTTLTTLNTTFTTSLTFNNGGWSVEEDWIGKLTEARAVLLRYYLLRKTLLRTGFHGLALKPC